MEKDARIDYIKQQNLGVAVARNAGIAHTNSKYVCCLDADDAMEQTFIEKCVRELERDNSLGLAYAKIRHILPNGKTGVSPWPGEWDFDDQLRRKNQVPTCNVFRREVWENLGGYKRRYCPMGAGSEDAEFWTRIGAYGWKCKLATAEPLFIYSLGSGRVSGNKEYSEPDWLAWHPWVKDGKHPFASYATPRRFAHPVRQYDEPVVSIIIPVGPGHEDVLEDALDSVEAQTFRQWECIVVWDREDYPFKRYVDAYPFVKWLGGGERRGPGYARNRGAAEARAPFLLFLDADDRLYFECVDKMLEEWKSEEAIIYSDYVGKAFIEDVGALSENLQKNILWRDDDGLTVIRYETPDYDVDRAQRQPHGDPQRVYTWNLITSLVPRAWHKEVGGFDEGMASWEDVDYWWRLAKRGKCFRRIAEPLVVYLFYTGGRRDQGLEMHKELFQYLHDKHEKEEIMGCRGCGGKSTRPAVPRERPVASRTQPLALQDDQFQMVLYNHPGRNQQTTIGSAVFDNRIIPNMIRDRGGAGWRINYGWRGGGEKFLAHVEDIRLAPHLFTPLEQRPAAPQVERQETPAPVSIAEVEAEAFEEGEGSGPPPPPKRIDVDAVMQSAAETNVSSPHIAVSTSANGFDWQKLPGVTAKIAEKLNGLDLEDVLEMGVEGLQEIQYVGPSRANSIYEAAVEAIRATA